MGLLQGDGCSFHPPSRAPVFWKLRRTLLELPPRPCFFRQSAARTTERASSSSQKGSSNTESHVSIKSCVWVVGRKPCQGSIAGGSGERTRACPSATLSGRRLTPPRPRPWKLSSAHYSHSPSPFPGHTAFREKRADETLWSEHETTLFPVKTFSTSQILGAAVRPTQLAAAPGKPPKEVPHCSSNPPPNNVEWLSLSWVSPCPLCLGDSSRFLRGELLSFWTNIYLHKHL